MHLKV